MKYLLLSLSLCLCAYNASALEQDEFQFLLDSIKQNNLDIVQTYLAEERATATTDSDYAHLLTTP